MDFLYRWRRPLIGLLAMMVLTTLLSYTAKLRGSVLTLQSVLSTVTAPVAGVVSEAGVQVGTAAGTVKQLFTLERQNQQLKSELALFKTMKLELSEVEADNTRLRGLLYLNQKLGHWKLVAATVVARNPASWFNTVTLNRGSRDGVRVGMPVIVPQGVVGRIVSVSPTTSQVMMLLDPGSGIGAMDVRSRSAGVLLGENPIDGTLRFQLFSHHPDVKPGDAVITSGFSQYYPKGLLLGQVVSVAHTAYGLTETATVAPAVNFNRLETVMIVMSHPQGESAPPVAGGAP